MYANDIVMIIRSQKKVDTIMRILKLYYRVIEAKINWGKFFLMKIKNLSNIEISKMSNIFEREIYKHLNIPVKVRIERSLKKFWKATLTKIKNTVIIWSNFRLFMKERVLTINACVMSLLRYALRFLEISIEIKTELKTKYYRMIWNNKMRDIIWNSHLCSSRDRERIENINLKCVIKTNVIFQIIKSMKYPETPFARLIKKILIIYGRSKQRKYIIKAISNLWIQIYSTQWDHLFKSLKYIWLRWRKIKGDDEIIIIQLSQSTENLLVINIWYHSNMRTNGGITNSGDAKKFNEIYWRDLWNKDVRVLEQIWDFVSEQIIVLNSRDSIHRERISILIKRLIDNCIFLCWDRWIKLKDSLRFY